MSDPIRQDAVDGPSPASTEDPVSAKETSPVATSRKLPGWLDHFNARDLKVLFRCTVAAWVASLLIFITSSLKTIGTATFFATLVLFMVPPSGIVFIFILGAFTLILGMALGWAWGVIAMKAALAARPAAETNAQLQALGQEAYSISNSTGQPLASVQQVLVYEGWMLDVRVSARLRAQNPKFVLLQIFGTISMDVFLTVGPLLPSFTGTIPKVLVEPAAIGIGIGLASSILLFPKSTSAAVLDDMEGIVRLLKGPTDVTYSSLFEGDPLDLKGLQKLKMKTIGAYKKMEPSLGFLQLDFSVGRWNADDVKSLKEPLRQALLSSLALLEMHIARLGGKAKVEKLNSLTLDRPWSAESEKSDKQRPREIGMRQLMENVNLIKILRSPEHESLRMDMLDAVRPPTKKILPICQEASNVIADCIHAVNSARWFGKPSQQRMDELRERSASVLETLQGLRSTFASETTERLLDTYAEIFGEDGCLKDTNDETMRKGQGIMMGMGFEEQILSMIDGWEKVLAQLVALMKERQKVRLWLPRGLRYAVNWVFHKKAVAPVQAAQSPFPDPDVVEAQINAAQQSLRISRGYKVKQRSGLGKAILGTYHWLICPEGMYALRMVVVTIACGVPAVIPSSAGFYYREKGLWALIMAQTSVVIYMSDFSLSFVSRAIGTVVGGLAGLVAWYIGSGIGDGNPYGLAAVMAVVLTLLMWGRLFAPLVLLQATMMCGATCILVVGYSYDDTHIPSYGNPGWGYNVFWRRLVLVLVGATAALIVQIFPRPPSAARHICKSLSNALRSLSDHYALLLSCWGQPDREEGLVAEQMALDLAQTLTSLDGPVALLRLEFSSSHFDSECLAQVKSLCQEMNQHIGRLLFLSSSLPEQFQTRLAHHAGLLDHRNVGDIMAVLGVVEQALKTGDPLPEVLPTPLLKRCFEFWKAHQVEIALSKDLIRDENYRRFCVAVSSYLKFLGAVDDLVLVMKGTLGESHIVSRELLHDLAV
ncbi:hypothetical protein N7533_006074 [Penicillium manginii]|uniref:uncharacterized protein n=1 Tax=Penicillium manginii TaxID=203109 RepID=UPI00254693A1|nr:uncharacterized protein N7533_006074 [Penicillium manginii]KAJ5756531.1 hypothetical protein N7533_006074 [Penicillium manginii]